MKRYLNKRQVLVLIFSIFTCTLFPQTFTEQTDIVLPVIAHGSTEWGDYDNDGDLDLLISGSASDHNVIVKIFRNDGSNSFIDIGDVFSPEVPSPSVWPGDNYMASWVDFNCDGFLDIVTAGKNTSSGYSLIIYKNEGAGTFTLQYQYDFLTFQGGTSFDCGDSDNDGDTDIVCTNSIASKILLNQGNFIFSEEASVSLPGLTYSSSKWIDYDNDGYLDILLTGQKNWNSKTILLQNQGNNSFVEQTDVNLNGVSNGDNEWADYNNDGFPDLLLSGGAYLYKNNGDSTFTYQLTENISIATGEWGDLDNDGDPDMIIAGKDYTSEITNAFINNGDNTFTKATDLNIDGVKNGSMDLGDYDNDGDLDIVLSGLNGPEKICKVYKNISSVNNPSPDAPAGLTSVTDDNNIVLSWEPVTTDNTSDKSISYNLMIGSVSGGTDIVAPNSSTSGYHKISSMGNGQLDTNFVLANLQQGTYYWKVQAIDNSFIGGTFSSESSFNYTAFCQAYSLNVPSIGGTEISLSWSRGNGDNCIVFMKEGNAGTAFPIDNTSYTDSDVFGLGSQIGTTGWFCVYKGDQNSVNIKGLTSLTEYVLQVQEFEGTPGSETYNNHISDQNSLVFKTGLFTELTEVHLSAVNSSSMGFVQTTDRCWLDFDNDDDLDLFLTGNMGYYLYENNGDQTFSSLPLTMSNGKLIACADVNNDGYIDITILGSSETFIYKNNGDNTFSAILNTSISGTSYGSIDWGDYDNDGDLDLILTGESGGSFQCITEIYRNNGDETFTKISNHNLPGIRYGRTDWGDYNNDGFLDIVLSGITNEGLYMTKVFKNDANGGFVEIYHLNSKMESIEWGDYDNDGDLDLLLISGSLNSIYRNEGNDSFSQQSQISLGSASYGAGYWGDYDNDGYLDIVITGYLSGYKPFSKIYRNNKDNTFQEDTNCVLTPAGFGNSAWGDYDNDSDLDLLLMGVSADSAFAKIYRNDIESVNLIPEAPTELASTVNRSTVDLIWNAVRSDSTNYLGMTYNLMVGSISGAYDLVTPHSSSGGYKRLVEMGNANLDTTFFLKDLPFGTYYWSVQAVDNGFAGSPFSIEDNFLIVPVQATNLNATILDKNSLLIKWEQGNGSRCVVFCKETTTDVAIPVNNESYLPDSEYGYGEQLGSTGWYCVYNGRSDSVIITGLSYKTDYSFHVIEFLGDPGGEQYFTEIVDGNPGVFSTGLFSEQTSISFNNTQFNEYVWGDYDNDGFSDILIPGMPSIIYHNNGDNTFSEVGSTSLPDVRYGSSAWGDYDNDGDLDIIISGAIGSYPDYLPANTKVYRNDGSGVFSEQTQISLDPVFFSSVDWGDYDNDGDLDIALTGATGNDPYYDPISKIFRNNGDGTFSEQEDIILPGVFRGDVKWVDYDNDGDIDLHLNGSLDYQYQNNCISDIYRNDGNNIFTEQTQIAFTGLWEASVDWGDYDNDGDMDVVMTRPGQLFVYQNQGDGFSNILSESYGYSSNGCVSWGDYDNDGFLDILFSKFSSSAIIFRNIYGYSFEELDDDSYDFTSVEGLEWCDYDNDSDIDVLVSQWGGNCSLYKNNLIMESGLFKSNNSAEAPNGLLAKHSPEGITLNWNPVINDETIYTTLSYNVKIGTNPDSANICPPHADTTGFRKIVGLGNASLDTSYLAMNLESGMHYWSVQAIDQGYIGGAWSVIDSFEVKNLQPFFTFDTVCFESQTQFYDQSIATDNILSWHWDFGDGTVSTEQNPVYAFVSSGTHQVTLKVQTAEYADSITKDVIVKPKPITEFSTDNACQGTSTNITNNTTLNGTTVTDWYWDFGDGESSDQQNPVSHGYLNPGDYNVKLAAYADNGCADSIQNIVTVAEYPVAGITASSPYEFCSGDSVILSVEYDENYLYSWKIGTGNITDADSSKYTAKISGTYSVEVVNSKGNCTTLSTDADVIVLDAPVPPYISADGAIIFCQGDSVVLSATENSAYSYQWKLNGGAVGEDSNEYIAKSSGTYTLTVTNSGGCEENSSNSIDVLVNASPEISAVNLSGATEFCEGGSLSMSVEQNDSYTYQWRDEYGIITGETTNSYTTTETGIYILDISNSSSCVVQTTPVNVSVKPMPVTPVLQSDNYVPGECLGTDPVKLYPDQASASYSYQWLRNGIQIINATESFLEDYLAEGDYSLIADIDGCTAESAVLNLNFKDAPAKPDLYVKGPVVWYMAASNNAASQYKWYHNGTLIPDADKFIYVANQTLGSYKVAIANDLGCFTMSNEITIPTTKSLMTDFFVPEQFRLDEDIDPFANLKIYPNPSPGMFTIEMDNYLIGELDINIFTSEGRQILNIKFHKTTQHFQTEIDLSGQGTGIYLILLYLEQHQTSTQIVIE